MECLWSREGVELNRVVGGSSTQKARFEQRFKDGKVAVLATKGRRFQVEGTGKAKTFRKESDRYLFKE